MPYLPLIRYANFVKILTKMVNMFDPRTPGFRAFIEIIKDESTGPSILSFYDNFALGFEHRPHDAYKGGIVVAVGRITYIHRKVERQRKCSIEYILELSKILFA